MCSPDRFGRIIIILIIIVIIIIIIIMIIMIIIVQIDHVLEDSSMHSSMHENSPNFAHSSGLVKMSIF